MANCSECSNNNNALNYNRGCNCGCSESTAKPARGYLANCDCNFTIAELQNKKGSYIFNIDGCSAKLDIKDGVKQWETLTNLTSDGQGNVTYVNEHGETQKVHIKQLLPYGRLEDLGNVGNTSGADTQELKEGCAFLFKQKGEDFWKGWKTGEQILQPNETAKGVMVFTENGCPRYLPAPENGLATLTARDGVVKWDTIELPAGANKDKFHPAWGNINETHAKQENGKWVPDRQNGIFTHNPQVDECNDIIVA
nr:MAG TPA: hypothetical protein [Bacteriophage sp.]